MSIIRAKKHRRAGMITATDGPRTVRKRRPPRIVRQIALDQLARLNEAEKAARQAGIILRHRRVAGRGKRDDVLHSQFLLDGYIVAEYWGSNGRLTIAGRETVAPDIQNAVASVVAQLSEETPDQPSVTKVVASISRAAFQVSETAPDFELSANDS